MTSAEGVSFMEDLKLELKNFDDAEIVIVPSFTALPRLSKIISELPGITLGAQNMWHESSGAFTGEVWIDRSIGLPARTTGTWFGAAGGVAASAAVDFSGWSSEAPVAGAFAADGLDGAKSVEINGLGL